MASAVVDIWVLSTGFQKSNISWPQQPPTKKVVNFNMIFHESSKSIFFQNIKIKLNSRTWMTPKSSVEIFQALEPLQPQWPLQPQQPPWPQWPLQPHFIWNITDCDGWIIPGTKMTNTCPFLGNGLSKILVFTNIWYPSCWRLLRPIDATFLKTRWWNINGQPSWPCSQRYTVKILNPSTP